ncbi:hypothetical protein BC835DRAFT_1344248, partial [Cytidiella melzeri]
MLIAVLNSGLSSLAATWVRLSSLLLRRYLTFSQLLNEYSKREVHLHEADHRAGGMPVRSRSGRTSKHGRQTLIRKCPLSYSVNLALRVQS